MSTTTKRISLSEAAPSQKNKKVRFSIPRSFGIDPATPGVLLGLQLLAAGREAAGHGIYIDELTLETGLEVVVAAGGKLKGYHTHDHSGPGTWYWEQDGSELDVAGFFSSISIAKSQLVAGRYEFFDTFKVDNKKEYDRVWEMAVKSPELLGLSIEAWGYCVYVDTKGVEYSQRPDDIELANEGLPTLRITDLFSAAFVSDPAATKGGLFAALGRGKNKAAAALRALLAELALDKDESETPAGSPANTPPAPAAVPPHSLGKDSIIHASPTMKLITELKAKYGTDQPRLTAALGIIAAHATPDTLTLAEVEVQLGAKELTDLRTQLGTVTTERDGLRTSLSTAEKDRDKYKNQLEALKASGVGGIDLGAGGGSPAGGEANPWMKATLNVSEQCKIQKADPTRAATLKAAAGVK